jgi:hypothetical protein
VYAGTTPELSTKSAAHASADQACTLTTPLLQVSAALLPPGHRQPCETQLLLGFTSAAGCISRVGELPAFSNTCSAQPQPQVLAPLVAIL